MSYVHSTKINGEHLVRLITKNFSLEPSIGEDGVVTFKAVERGTHNEVPNNNGRYKIKHRY